jgi:phage tail protein X
MRIALIGALAALALCACGAVGAGALPSPTPSPSYPALTPGHGFDVVVSEKDRAVTLRTGQRLEVVLHANPGMTNWGGVRSTDTAILAPVPNPAATAVRGVTLAGFQALKPGHVQIEATAGAACPSPGQACPMYAMVISIDVTVTA